VPARGVIRFSTRKVGERGRLAEVAHFYSPGGGKVFHAYCERGVIYSFLERVGCKAKGRGRVLYLEGDGAADVFRRLAVLAGARQSVRVPAKVQDIAEAVAGLGELELIFWYSRMVEEHERNGYWGVCRVARAFRTVYRVD